MSSGQITFFDLPSKEPKDTWSPNTWKTRFMLNYKGLDYKTEWLEYPEVRKRLENHVPPQQGGPAPYTCPAIQLADGNYIMDSKAIATYLEANYPDRPVELDTSYTARMGEILPALYSAIIPVFFPVVPERILGDGSRPMFVETRTQRVGMPLDELARTKGGSKAWDAAEAPLKQITGLLKENADGPFFEGGKLTYADFIWGGMLLWFQKMGEDIFGELLRRTGDEKVHGDLMDALKPWSERSNY